MEVAFKRIKESNEKFYDIDKMRKSFWSLNSQPILTGKEKSQRWLLADKS